MKDIIFTNELLDSFTKHNKDINNPLFHIANRRPETNVYIDQINTMWDLLPYEAKTNAKLRGNLLNPTTFAGALAELITNFVLRTNSLFEVTYTDDESNGSFDFSLARGTDRHNLEVITFKADTESNKENTRFYSLDKEIKKIGAEPFSTQIINIRPNISGSIEEINYSQLAIRLTEFLKTKDKKYTTAGILDKIEHNGASVLFKILGHNGVTCMLSKSDITSGNPELPKLEDKIIKKHKKRKEPFFLSVVYENSPYVTDTSFSFSFDKFSYLYGILFINKVIPFSDMRLRLYTAFKANSNLDQNISNSFRIDDPSIDSYQEIIP